MPTPPPQERWAEQRHEPLPGLLGLPRFAWRRTGRRARAAAVVAGTLAVAGTAIAIPLIAAGKRAGSAAERRADAIERAREARRLRADQAPHRGQASNAPRAPQRARREAVVAALERSVTADAKARRREGTLAGPPVLQTVCRADNQQIAGLQPAARRAGGSVLACLAVTSVGAAAGGASFAVGYEFVAAANWRRATFTWCKTNPAPGEKFGGARSAEVPLARACVDPAA